MKSKRLYLNNIYNIAHCFVCVCVWLRVPLEFLINIWKKIEIHTIQKNEIHTIKKYILKISFSDYLKSGI